jgi:hypothetical protein
MAARISQYPAYWLRPDGTYFGGGAHADIGIEELNKLNIPFDEMNDYEIYKKLDDAGYIRLAFYDNNMAVQTLHPIDLAGIDRISSFIVENRLEDLINEVGVDDNGGFKRYTKEDFLKI